MLTLSEKWKFHLIFARRSKSSREREFQGTKVPESESSMYGAFIPRSESTWEWKFLLPDQVVLQQDLARLEQWASTWGMVFNESKCHIMHISRPSSYSHQYMYQFRGIVLSSTTSEKYLGVYLNHDLK